MKIPSLKICLFFILILLFCASPGLSQAPDEIKNLRKEIDEMKETQKAIQKDLQEIKGVLRARGLIEEDPQNLLIDISGRPFKGSKDARLVMIEFSEYQ
ncbi:MAG: hypothetical protein FJ110_17945 [Deltaproteobacteria bacterium]|nr:hypothetical protein [Deltaproteobacteria bacterium]